MAAKVNSSGYVLKIPGADRYHGWGSSEINSIPTLDAARKMACSLLPRNSSKRSVVLYRKGTMIGKMIHYRGSYMYESMQRDTVYEINPRTGKVADYIML